MSRQNTATDNKNYVVYINWGKLFFHSIDHTKMQKIGTIIKLRFGRTSYHQISFLFY